MLRPPEGSYEEPTLSRQTAPGIREKVPATAWFLPTVKVMVKDCKLLPQEKRDNCLLFRVDSWELGVTTS